MSSPATIAETSDTAQPSNTLLIIPDGSQLWTDPQQKQLSWRLDALTTMVEQLPVSKLPILIGAEGRTTEQLLNSRFTNGWRWDEHLASRNLTVLPRFVGSTYVDGSFGSTDPGVKRTELWFVGNRASRRTYDWSSVLRRLGFDVRKWNSLQTLTENLAPTDEEGHRLPPRAINPVINDERPTTITIGTLVDLELVTTEYPLTP